MVVIGAGPAGCTAACRLAQMGHQVALVERKKFPRDHIGESIPGEALSLLKVISADFLVDMAGFLRTNSSLVHWTVSKGTVRKEFYGTPHLQVDRGLFDKLLLEHARSSGVVVFQPAVAIPRQMGELSWLTEVVGADLELKSPIVLDASGGSGLRSGRLRYSPPTIALFGYFESDFAIEPVSRVEAFEESWMWSAPLAGGTTAVAVFADGQWLRKRKSSSLESLIRDEFEKSTLFKYLKSARLAKAMRACDASIFGAREPIKNGLIRLGDALLSMDPLSSQGGLMAIASGLQASILANTLLKEPDRRELVEDFAFSSYKERLKKHLRSSSFFYREKLVECDTYFWRARVRPSDLARPQLSSVKCPVQLDSSCSIRETPIIAGDLISTQPSLQHPLLDGPIAFVKGLSIVTLLQCLADKPSAAILLQRWKERVGNKSSVDLFLQLWAAGVISEGI